MSETQEVVVDVVVDSEVDVEHLITLVAERPVIWDKSLEEYKDRSKNRDAWHEVCLSLCPGFEEKQPAEKKELGSQLLKKWKNIRDSWMKHVRKEKNTQKSGAGASKVKKYIYNDQLQFLHKVALSNSTCSTIGDPDDVDAPDSPEQGTQAPVEGSNVINVPQDVGTSAGIGKNKRKSKTDDRFELKMMKLLEPEEDDPQSSFFKSILPTIKTFTNSSLIFKLVYFRLLRTKKSNCTFSSPSQLTMALSTNV